MGGSVPWNPNALLPASPLPTLSTSVAWTVFISSMGLRAQPSPYCDGAVAALRTDLDDKVSVKEAGVSGVLRRNLLF